MINPKLLRSDLDFVADNLAKRGYVLDKNKLRLLEVSRKELQIKVEQLRQQRNKISKSIGKNKGKGLDISEIKKDVDNVSASLINEESKLKQVNENLDRLTQDLPNLLHESVPQGKDDSSNKLHTEWGSPKTFSFDPLDHVELAEGLGLIDLEGASKLSGSRFAVLRNDLAMLHRALAQFMIDIHTLEHGYEEMYLPYLVNSQTLFGTGQLPKFKQDLFFVDGEKDLALIPTAEVPLTNLLRDKIVKAENLPMKLVAHTPCFRSEAGSYGKDTRGMIRQHQFDKVELVQIVKPEDSYNALDELLSHAEIILRKLNLPYRVVTLCSGDTGFSASKTFDIEVWLPSQNCFREISSCSNCEDFQSRRIKARWKNLEMQKPELVHTLNGSGVAVGRALIAILENYQNEDGTITIPDILRPYMKNREIISTN
ncbi:MAG: serine--tRNA ligase [Gammaproteobacteria bacterium TMED78]|nr:MAG: serine--tRNA ligase [Gammaproteobacteria bacterium TMED78]|tara:strand:- start:44451 stop:45731 length:1281 start_codon:yes stop_codon:yes gene_type:complete